MTDEVVAAFADKGWSVEYTSYEFRRYRNDSIPSGFVRKSL